MSLEAALAENTAALNNVAALLAESNKTREAALAKIREAGPASAHNPPGRPPRGKPKEATPADEAPSRRPKSPRKHRRPKRPSLH